MKYFVLMKKEEIFWKMIIILLSKNFSVRGSIWIVSFKNYKDYFYCCCMLDLDSKILLLMALYILVVGYKEIKLNLVVSFFFIGWYL